MGKYLITIFFLTTILYSQEHNSENDEHELLHHKLFIQYGLVHVPAGHEEGEHEETGTFIASYGLGYAYRINHKWALAMEVNLESGNYVIKEDIPRENALIVAVVGAYEIMPRWALFFGGGIEIEKHQNYAVFRVGTEYIFPIGKDWELSPVLTFDHKTEYTSWEIALMLGKRF